MISAETLNSQHNSVIGEKSLDSLSNLNPNALIFMLTPVPEAVGPYGELDA